MTASKRAAAILESTSEEVSTADCRAYAVSRWRPPWRPAAPRWRRLCSRARESVGHLGVHLQRRDPRRYVQGVLVHHRLEAVVGGHLAWRCWPRRWSRSWPPWCCSWTASGPRRPGCSWWPPRPPARRRPTLESPVVSELCSAAMLLPCAATWPGAVARGAIAGASALLSSFEASSAVTLSSRDWMAAALLPAAAVFTARSVT